MRSFLCLFAFLLLSGLVIADPNLILTDLKDKSIRCDYLIVSPDSFLQQSERLALHHYNNQSPDVLNPRVVSLSTIYKQFKLTDTTRTFEAIRDALQWANENWAQPFTFAVLMGDDSIGTQVSNPKEWNRGPMPSFSERQIDYIWDSKKNEIDTTLFDTSYTWGDSRYSYFSDTLNRIKQSLFMTARIPCENIAQCSIYIDKVVNFTSQKRQAWNNRAIFLADDDFQGIIVDPISTFEPHMVTSRSLSDNFFKGYDVCNIFTGFYQLDDNSTHTLARDDYFSNINNGALWTIYVGHGHQGFLSDETIVSGKDAYRFKNIAKNGAFLSLSCSNGAYHLPFEKSMCKQFLFVPETGYLVYIASIVPSSAWSNNMLAESFFKTCDTSKEKPLGLQWWISRINEGTAYNDIYSFMGDPALYFSKNSAKIQITLKQGSSNTYHCDLNGNAMLQSGLYQFKVSVLDSMYPLDGKKQFYQIKTDVDSMSGSFTGSFDLPVRSEYLDKKLKIVAYAWNDTADARGELILDNTTSIKFLAKNSSHRHSISIIGNIAYFNNNHSFSPATTLSIYSSRGQKIYTKSLSPKVDKIALDNVNVSSGVYVINVSNVKGTVSCRWIKR